MTTPLPAGETVGLDDDGQAETGKRGQRLRLVRAADIAGGGDAGLDAQVLGEALGALEPGGRRARPETGMPSARNVSAMPSTSGASGPTTTRPMSVASQKSMTGLVVGQVEVDQPGDLRYPRIARRGEQPRAARRLRQLPGEGMFATAAAQQKDVHGRGFPSRMK